MDLFGNFGTWFLPLWLLVNVFVFLLFGYDKLAAKRFPRNRISENGLIVSSLFLAFPGAEIARRVFHHKTQDVEFKRKYFMFQAIEGIVVVLLLAGNLFFGGR